MWYNELNPGGTSMSFGIYLIGHLILIVGMTLGRTCCTSPPNGSSPG